MPHIVGKKVFLREYRMEDLEAVNRWRNLEEITLWTGVYVWPESIEETRAFLDAQTRNVDPANRKFAVCRLEDGAYVGHVGYEHLELRRRNTELGIVLGVPTLLSQGMGQEAINLFLKVCFDELNLHRVGLRVLSFNARARRCYEKCGFSYEGAIRQWHHAGGAWHDLMLMGLLQEEYRALQEKAAS